MDESTARRLVLVRAFDGADSPLWTAEDAAWASRLAAQTAPAQASPERFLAERARHAIERIVPRERRAARWLSPAGWRWPWLVAAAAAGLLLGLSADLLGRAPVVDILSPSAWAVTAWNLGIYLWLLACALKPAGARGGILRRALQRALQRSPADGPLRDATRQWLPLAAPATAARVAALLHVAAAAVGAGLVAGMYLRGLVFDFRAGWQSTFVDAETVQRTLAALLAPAAAVTGIGVPDIAAVDAMRLTPASPHAGASAAPWIHLYAATLGLFVMLPRAALALAALLQAGWRAGHVALPLDEPYFQRLLRQRRSAAAVVRVRPYAAGPAAQALLALRTLLAREFGDDVQLRLEEVTRIGDEDALARAPQAEAAALQVGWVELGATPEDETHGRFLQALRRAAPGVPLLLLADEADFLRRFASVPARVDERRAAWRQFAAAQGVALLCADPAAPPGAAAEAALKAALGG